ncbi:hypothetical protein [Bradyrhizobium yuanmingense]|uniref:hypothetical protein n=1 Tax=Bradyrhizobium yuanmingense TaxID=108015 RepID=UPI0023B9425F|nr:hypothetical protein [Bradyrhizobium yuanmingense]MDF0498446.1 hypothetical protein [Bradyrhizobium yuanmingense]
MIDAKTPRQTSWSTAYSTLLDLRGRAFRVVWIAADLRWRHQTIMGSLNAQGFSPDPPILPYIRRQPIGREAA